MGGDGEDEAEDMVEDFFGKPIVYLAHAGLVRHRIGGTKAEEVTERRLSVHRQEIDWCDFKPSK